MEENGHAESMDKRERLRSRGRDQGQVGRRERHLLRQEDVRQCGLGKLGKVQRRRDLYHFTFRRRILTSQTKNGSTQREKSTTFNIF